MKLKEPEFVWDENSGIAICKITSNGIDEIGVASCHPDDRDMMNEYTGCAIAQFRAQIKAFKHIRSQELKPQLAALKQLYYSMNKSKHYNPKSYEAKMLNRQIKIKENELEELNHLIKDQETMLTDYIEGKADFYSKIRKNRKKLDEVDSVGQDL